MMKLNDIRDAAASLGNQLRAGIPLDQAVDQMAMLQPDHAEMWQMAVVTIRSGHPLSEVLEGVWPEAMVSAVRAGEKAGKPEEVLGRIETTVILQLDLRAAMRKLIYPLAMGLVGAVIFVSYMTLVMPDLLKSLGTNRSSGFVHELSSWMSVVFVNNWVVTVGVLIGGCVLLSNWLRTEDGRLALQSTLLSVPILREALRDLYFGLWGHYMALMASAGIATREALVLTTPVLPAELQESVVAFGKDLADNRGMADAANPKMFREGDPRKTWWPFYISNAFIVAQNTGEIDVALERVCPSLIRSGVDTLNRFIAFANVVALGISAFLIVSPLAIYYTEVFSAIRNAGR